MPTSIGPFKILGQLGEGGMGVVYLAEQSEPVRRKVALKLIRPGMDSKQVLARFESERQALALMDHPGIARVFEAGTTTDGRPYFAMEHVQGVPITRYCDSNQMSLSDRLRLFIEVCQAVEHAHQKGVIHRDLKPSNVMVAIAGDRPTPKIIDFGVAKATHQSLTDRTLHTQLGQLIGTPDYMSPEQAEMSGLNVDTRTDVYALGVLLYELITGQLPFDAEALRQAPLSVMQQTILESDPPRPSTRVSQLDVEQTRMVASARGTPTTTITRDLRGDLDWIVVKALEKDRTRRYQSPSAMAADIQRHLDDQPVEAGPPSTIYRVRKFTRRHRALVLSTAVVLIVLIAGVVASTIFGVGQARARVEADSQRRIAEATSSFLTDMLSAAQPKQARGEEVTVRDVLEQAASGIDGRFQGQPEVEAAIRFTIGDTYQTLADYDRALPYLERALELYRGELDPDDERIPETLGRIGMVRWLMGDLAGSQRDAEEVLAIRERTLGRQNVQYTDALGNVANTHADMGQLDKAEQLLRQALALERELLTGDAESQLAFTVNNLATVLTDRKKYAEAAELHRESLELRRRHFGDDSPTVTISLGNLGRALHGAGQLDEAETTLREALAHGQRILGDEHLRTGSIMVNLGALLGDRGHFDEGEDLIRQGLAIFDDTAGPRSWRSGSALGSLGELLIAAGRVTDAERNLEQAKEILTAELGADHHRTIDVETVLGNLRK